MSRLNKDDWDDLKPQVFDLYVIQNLSINEVARELVRIINYRNGLGIR
jgi:hypothetical protein